MSGPLEPPWISGSGGASTSGGGSGGGGSGGGGSGGSGGGGSGGGSGSAGGGGAGPPAPPSPPPPPPGAKVVSEGEAQVLFDKLKNQKGIPFDYTPDCCYARASEMGDLLAAEGVEAKKVWTYGTLVPMSGGKPVTFPPGSVKPTDQVVWGYHVAPTIPVRRASGVVEDMVMDPSLSKKPLTIAEWNDIMRGPGSSITQTAQTARDVFYRAPDGTPLYETAAANRATAFKAHIIKRDAALGRP